MKKKPEPKTIAHAMRWPRAIKLEIQAAAKQQGRSFSEFVRSAALAAARGE